MAQWGGLVLPSPLLCQSTKITSLGLRRSVSGAKSLQRVRLRDVIINLNVELRFAVNNVTRRRNADVQ